MTLGQPIQQFVYRFLLSGKYEQIYSQLNESHKHSLYQTNRICKSGFRYHDVWSCLLYICIYIYIYIASSACIYGVVVVAPEGYFVSNNNRKCMFAWSACGYARRTSFASKNRVYCAIYIWLTSCTRSEYCYCVGVRFRSTSNIFIATMRVVSEKVRAWRKKCAKCDVFAFSVVEITQGMKLCIIVGGSAADLRNIAFYIYIVSELVSS